jgi:hypothetical protein
MKKILVLVLFPLMHFAGCKKEGDGSVDTEKPVIMVSSPTSNQAFSAGQVISITAAVTDNVKITGMHMEIINSGSGAFFTHEHYAPNANSYTLSKTFTPQTAGTYLIKIGAEDSKGNKAEAKLTVSAN